MKLYPSIASADPLRIAGELDRLKNWPYLHFDMEDGSCLGEITFGCKMMHSVSSYIQPRRMDIHLTVADPMRWLPDAAKANALSVCAHIESLRYPLLFLNGVRALGMKAGLALSVKTPLCAVEAFLSAMDFLLVMTAEPDALGERLYLPALEKAETAARNYHGMEVLADGGLDAKAAARLKQAGAAGCILGRLAFSARDPYETLRSLV